MSARILCVDDEPKLLSALRRQLHERFELTTATGAAEALEMIASAGPFAVVVSDLRMPGMDGIQFLSEVRRRAPDSVRIILTGFADLPTTVEAVNAGNLFRFLTKPCEPAALARALEAGVYQYRLVTAERELLEKTLRGALKVLAEVLSLTNPVAFGHAARVQRLVAKLCRHMQVAQPWQIEIAATLSQIGCVTIPPDTLERAYRREPLQPQDVQMLAAHPCVAADLIRNIPRLEEVARIVAYQGKGFDGSGVPRDALRGPDLPLGARILKAALDYDALQWSGRPGRSAVRELRQRAGRYDPAVLAALEAVIAADEPFEIREFTLAEIRPHAVLADDLRTPDGCLLIGQGQEITPSVRQLLCNYARRKGIQEQIRIRAYVDAPPDRAPRPHDSGDTAHATHGTAGG